jgi:hypothetical protein
MSAFVEVRRGRARWLSVEDGLLSCIDLFRAPISPAYVLSSSMTPSTIKAISSVTSGLRNFLLRRPDEIQGTLDSALPAPPFLEEPDLNTRPRVWASDKDLHDQNFPPRISNEKLRR